VPEPTQQQNRSDRDLPAEIADAIFDRYMQGEAATRAYLLDRGFEPAELNRHEEAARVIVSRTLREHGVVAEA
jgi:hypothetical protein